MLSPAKVLFVVFCELLLSMGLSTVAQTEILYDDGMQDGQRTGATQLHPMEGTQPPGGKTIQGEVLRVEGDECVIKSQDDKEVRVQIDQPLLKAAGIEPGDRIEAKVDNQNQVLSFSTSGHGPQK